MGGGGFLLAKVNTRADAGGREAARGLAAGVSFGLQYAE